MGHGLGVVDVRWSASAGGQWPVPVRFHACA